jgi:two-component system chemotaxis sensor kinase CheA
MDAMEEFRASFLEECDELLGSLEQRLAAMDAGSDDKDDINAAFRAIHSIKGGAGAFGFPALVEIAHVFEAALDLLRSGRMAIADAPISLFLRAADHVASHVVAARSGGSIEASRELVDALKAAAANTVEGAFHPAAMEALVTGGSSAAPATAPPSAAPLAKSPHGLRVRISSAEDSFRRAVDIRNVFAGLEGFGELSVQTILDRLPSLEDTNALSCRLDFDVRIATKVERQIVEEYLGLQLGPEEFAIEIDADGEMPPPEAGVSLLEDRDDVVDLGAGWLEESAQSSATEPAGAAVGTLAAAVVPPIVGQPDAPKRARSVEASSRPPGRTAASPARARATGSIRVDLERIDKLMNLVGEIVITQSMLDQRLLSLSVAETIQIADGLQILGRQTRELQESVMAVRAQPVGNVFQRMSRLVRELAQALGKEARIVLIGDDTEVDKTIIEELADPLTHMIRNSMDHGIEPPADRIAAGKPAQGTITLQAEQRGGRIVITVSDDGRGINREKLLAKARSRGIVAADHRMANEEIDQLLFHAGLSTADSVTDVSGRGVGMDVVKQNIEQLGGRIAIASEAGKGSRFTMLLPLTLAVMDGMIIRASGERFVLPIASIIETLQFSETTVERLPDGQEFLRLRDRLSPLVRLGGALGVGPCGEEQVIVMTETDRGERIGLAVDEIVNQQQVVVKSLEANYGPVPGASAATILGDGLVALIVDVDAIPSLNSHYHHRPDHARSTAETLH